MDERRLNLKVQYSDSVIYDKDTFTWNRVAGDKTFPTTIVKPLKAENSVDSAVVLADGEYTILSGVRNASGEINRQGLPGMSDAPILQDIGDNSTKATQEETIIVVKPVFPKRKKVIQIEKSTSF